MYRNYLKQLVSYVKEIYRNNFFNKFILMILWLLLSLYVKELQCYIYINIYLEIWIYHWKYENKDILISWEYYQSKYPWYHARRYIFTNAQTKMRGIMEGTKEGYERREGAPAGIAEETCVERYGRRMKGRRRSRPRGRPKV